MNWKITLGGILAALGIGFGVGYSQKKVETVTKTVEVEKQVEVQGQKEIQTVVQWRDRIVTVEKIVHPDGTTEERTVTEDKQLDKQMKEQEQTITSLKEQLRVAQTSTKSAPVLSHYSLGIYYPLKFSEVVANKYDVRRVSPSLGVRLLGPLWLEGQFRIEDRTPIIGVRYEF